MNSLESRVLSNFTISPNLLEYTERISEYRGKQVFYEQMLPGVLDTLLSHSVIESTESSNRLEGIVVTSRRFDSIMSDKAKPQSRSEAEIVGYRDVLRTIHERHDTIPIRPDTVLQLHHHLTAYVGSGQGGRWKTDENVLEESNVGCRPTPAWQTPEAIDRLCTAFYAHQDSGQVPDVILIGTFVLDFLCIHPFQNGNGRMARLLTLLLLYQSGYLVGKYISIEGVVQDTRNLYYDTLYRSSLGWNEGENDLEPWTEYFLAVIARSYDLFENKVGDLKGNQERGWKQKRVRDVVESFMVDFTIADVEERCPGIGRPMISKILHDMRKEGTTERIEHGRRPKWVVVRK